MCLRNLAGNLLRVEQQRQDGLLQNSKTTSSIWIFYKNLV